MDPERILKILINTGEIAGEVLFSGYQNSYRSIKRRVRDLPQQRSGISDAAEKIREYGNFRMMMSRLQKDGLVEKSGRGLGAFWKISKSGKQRFTVSKKNRKKLPKLKHNNTKQDYLKIVTFDIPEKERRKRDWLRRELVALEFTPMQKSVWVGRPKLSQEFLRSLKELRIDKYVQIFEITKKGTIEKI